MRLALSVVLAWLAAGRASAATIQLLPSDDYTKLEAAEPGDTVLVAPGTYRFRVHLVKQGRSDAPITIQAADPLQPPVWDLDGQPTESWPGSGSSFGCWFVEGAYYRIIGITFHGCRSDKHPTGAIVIRGSDHLLVRRSLFDNNDQGMEGDGENTVIEFSEIRGNGTLDGNNATHNLYISGGGSFTLRYSYVHDSADGVNFKIDTREAILEGNWIARGHAGTGHLETANGRCGEPQRLVLRGNVIVGSSGEFLADEIDLFNSGAGPHVQLEVIATWNTIVLPTEHAVFSVRNDTFERIHMTVANNIIVGAQRAVIVADPGANNYTVDGDTNWMTTGTDPRPLAGTTFGADPGFAGTTFHLAAGSPAIGVASVVADPPTSEYSDDESRINRFRPRTDLRDVGAFESTTPSTDYGSEDGREAPPTEFTAAPAPRCSGCSSGGPDQAVWLALCVPGLLRRSRAAGSRAKPT